MCYQNTGGFISNVCFVFLPPEMVALNTIDTDCTQADTEMILNY